jgi:oxaloacetate decarboxylase alpha subunit
VSDVRFIDTTVRDGNQSLWALNMRTDAMLDAAGYIDQAGFEAAEFFVTVQFKKMVRELKENPWDWLRLGSKRFKKTPIRLHGGLKTIEKIPICVFELMIQRIMDYGITVTRTSNSWNDYDEFEVEKQRLKKLGMDTIVNLIYSVSPRHTDDYYARKAREAAAIKPIRICFKDVGGLLTLERARTLIPIVLENVGETPIEFHAHCNNGLAPLCYLEAVKLGMTTLHTAVPPLANGSGQPSIFNVARNLRAMGHNPVIDEEVLRPASDHLRYIAKRDGLPIGRVMEYDESQYTHQVPGGMISNFRHQLTLIHMEDKLDAILKECVQVRKEFGYPIMVTPLSQFVGTQAAINVITGKRYKEVTDQAIQYALGYWGREGAEYMDPEVKDAILSRPRARQWASWELPTPSIQEVRRQLGATHLSDEEFLLRVFAGEDAVRALPSRGAPKQYLSASVPLVRLIAELTRQDKANQIYIRKPDFSLTLSRSGS